mmetsp:Transcript_21851/g.49795  ORF Transcript_21851/g.49795 Transcript_21851/m.49795 type:complete len:216 (-) Transcript_21851:33-680(-)
MDGMASRIQTDTRNMRSLHAGHCTQMRRCFCRGKRCLSSSESCHPAFPSTSVASMECQPRSQAASTLWLPPITSPLEFTWMGSLRGGSPCRRMYSTMPRMYSRSASICCCGTEGRGSRRSVMRGSPSARSASFNDPVVPTGTSEGPQLLCPHALCGVGVARGLRGSSNPLAEEPPGASLCTGWYVQACMLGLRYIGEASVALATSMSESSASCFK